METFCTRPSTGLYLQDLFDRVGGANTLRSFQESCLLFNKIKFAYGTPETTAYLLDHCENENKFT